MTARDDLAVLLLKVEGGVTPHYPSLDAIARLATDPETAPAVFAWLVEAGVLKAGTEACDCTDAPVVDAGALLGDGPWHYHYHAAMDHEKASGVEGCRQGRGATGC